jgi:hypothetical protein
MYIVNQNTDILQTGDYLKKGQEISDKKAESLLKINPKLNFTKHGKTKKKSA